MRARFCAALLALLLLAHPVAAAPVATEELLQAAASGAEWLLYGRTYANLRYSPLDQVRPDNVGRLKPVWSFEFPDKGAPPEATPLVRDGTLYFTASWSRAFAVDARTGKPLWTYEPDYDFGVATVICCSPANRGLAIKDDRLFLETLDAQLVALDRASGEVLWQAPVGDWRKGEIATNAPLVVGERVLTGMSGGDFGVRGHIDAFDAATGAPQWRTFTVPGPGEPGNETWPGDTWKSGGGAPWVTGAYDPELDTVYWGTGNPAPWNSDLRKGDNLWTDSLLALDPATGRIKWGFQYTPNDGWDYDGAGAPVLVDATIDGQPVKAAVQANRNGFLYVLDRETGRFLYALPTLQGINWTTGIDPATGRPAINEAKRPVSGGPRVESVMPGIGGGTGWYPIAFNPDLGYVFVLANTSASHMQAKPADDVHYLPGVRYEGIDTSYDFPSPNVGAVEAFSVSGKKLVWQAARKDGVVSGLLATRSGLVFAGDTGGTLFALDAATGKTLWEQKIGIWLSAPPITYELDGKQYLAVLAVSEKNDGLLEVFALE